MTEEQKKEMLNGIINNGEKWECQTSSGGYPLPWKPYKLGDEIHDNWKYRKVEKKTWLEEEISRLAISEDDIKVVSSLVCKKILEEVKSKIAEKQVLGFTFSQIDSEELKEIIKDLGVEV